MQLKISKTALISVVVFVFACFVFTPIVLAEAQKVSLQNVKGPVEVVPPGAKEGSVGMNGTALKEGDMVKTYGNSTAEIVIEGVGTIYIKPSSHITITTAQKKGDTTETITTLGVGTIRAKVEKLLSTNSRFETRTPVSVAAVRGTTYIVSVTENGQTTVYVVDGEVALTNLLNNLSVQVAAGQVSVASADGSVTGPTLGSYSEGEEDAQDQADELEDEAFDPSKGYQYSVIEGEETENPSPSE